MSWSLVNSVVKAGGGESAPIDTTGADLLIAVVSDVGVVDWTVSDSKGNTWINLTEQQSVNSNIRISYAWNATVGSGHTFTLTGGSFHGAVFMAFSGSLTTGDPFDQQNGDAAASVTSLQTGSVTPSEDGELLIAARGSQGGSPGDMAIDSGFTIAGRQPNSGGSVDGAAAYLAQETAAAINPQWSWETERNTAASIATFKGADAGGGVTTILPFVNQIMMAG